MVAGEDGEVLDVDLAVEDVAEAEDVAEVIDAYKRLPFTQDFASSMLFTNLIISSSFYCVNPNKNKVAVSF